MNRIYRLFVSLSALLGVAAFPVMAQDEEVNLNKTATYNYETHVGEITLESFVPGSVHYVYDPFDVVMVLDVSDSMDDHGKFDKMKAGAKKVVSILNEMAAKGGDARVAIVTFASDAETKIGLTTVNSTSAKTLNDIIDGLKTGVRTYTDKGLSNAYDLLKDVDPKKRKQFVMLFTDGLPGNNQGDPSVARRAAQNAYEIKKHGAEIFSILLWADTSRLPSVAYINNDSSSSSSWGTNVSVERFLQNVSSLYPLFYEYYYSSGFYYHYYESYSDPKYKSTSDYGKVPKADTDVEYYKWTRDASELEGIFEGIITHIVSGASKLEAHTTMKDFVNNNFFQYPDNADEGNITIKKQQCTNYDKTTKVFTFGPDMELTPAEKANVKIELTRADKSNPNSRDLIEVYGYDYAANWCGMDESVTPAVPHGYKLVIKFPFIFKGGEEVSGALKTNTEDSGIYPVQTDEEGHPKTDPSGKPIPEDKPTKEYIPPTILFNTLTITRTNLDEGETAIYKVERNGVFVCNVALGGVKGKETEGVSKTIYGLPGDAGQMFRVTETNWNWAYHTGGVLPYKEKEVTTTTVIEDDKEIIKPDPLEFEFSGPHRTNKSDPDDPVNYHNHGESFVVNKLILP